MIRETQRTLSYVDLILAGNWKEIGRLFFESYDDSRDFSRMGIQISQHVLRSYVN